MKYILFFWFFGFFGFFGIFGILKIVTAGHFTGINHVTEAPQVRLEIDHFTWNFLRAKENAWALAHILNPFLLQMIFQDWKVTVIIFFLWESIETFFLVTFKDYKIFLGDEDGFEPVADSLIGDPLNGLLGLLLAWMFTITFKVPYWTPGPWSRARIVWWRRIGLYLISVISFQAYNAFSLDPLTGNRLPVGIYLTIGLLTLWLGLSWKYWSFTSMEMHLFWGGWSEASLKHRDQVYLSWITLLILFQFVAVHQITYVYFQVWAIWLVAMLILLLIMAAQGRFHQFFYFASFQDRKQRFYHDPGTQLSDGDFTLAKN